MTAVVIVYGVAAGGGGGKTPKEGENIMSNVNSSVPSEGSEGRPSENNDSVSTLVNALGPQRRPSSERRIAVAVRALLESHGKRS